MSVGRLMVWPGRVFMRSALWLALLLAWTIAPQARAVSLSIHDIQGSSHLSPYAGQTVSGIPGVVTALRAEGFYLQEPNPDGEAKTSEGIFVLTGEAASKPAPGDSLLLDGQVSEYRQMPDGLTRTQIVNPTWTVQASGQALPTPIILGAGGPVPPTTYINQESANVETGGVFVPTRDALDYFESMEGMRVQVPEPVAVSGNDSSGQIVVLPMGGMLTGALDGRVILQKANDDNPERITLDNSILPAVIPLVRAGTRFQAPYTQDAVAVGVMDYAENNFRVVLTQALPADVNFTPSQPNDAVTPDAQGRLSLAVFDLEKLSAADLPAAQPRLEQIAHQIVFHLAGPDLLVLQGVEKDGPAAAGADGILTALVAEVQGIGGASYAWLQIDPDETQDGGSTRAVILYNPARLQPAPAPAGDAISAVQLSSTGRPHLTLNPGRIDPPNAAFSAAQKPVAAELLWHGHSVFILAAPLVARSSDQPLFGPIQPPLYRSRDQRNAQAAVLNAFAAEIESRDCLARVIVLGDFNDTPWSPALAQLSTGGDATVELYDLASLLLPDTPQYTYIQDGNAQKLDFILVSPAWLAQDGSLDAARTAYSQVHINSERAAADPLRTSGHDPLWAVLAVDEMELYLPALWR